MKDAINYFAPIVQDPINDVTGKCIPHHISTNGYYGYQPVTGKPASEIQTQSESLSEMMDTNWDSGVQFNNFIEIERDDTQMHVENKRANRKRTWAYDSAEDIKKRRENEPLPMHPDQLPFNNKQLNVRQPTHNIPDMPRCMMGHYI